MGPSPGAGRRLASPAVLPRPELRSSLQFPRQGRAARPASAAAAAAAHCLRSRPASRWRHAASQSRGADSAAPLEDDDVWLDALGELEEEEEEKSGGFDIIDLPDGKERVFLVGFELKRDRGRSVYELGESLDELARLADSAGLEVVGRTSQRLEAADPRTLIGSGKITEVLDTCSALRAETIIFDCDLSPRQGRNIEELTGGSVRVCDRTSLILDIFAQRAATKEGKLQVQLAQAQYQLPRLTRMWSHLDRISGSGMVKGTGESQLQIDKRLLKDRMRQLSTKLEAVRTHRNQYRSRRVAAGIPVIALCGYTNAGKSTLLNVLSGSDVLAEDKLFATLDPTTRRVRLPNGKEVVVTDTVGFIQNLPTELVASFRATLEEISEASVIVHVVDASQPNRDRQIKAVTAVLADLDVLNAPMIMTFNKIDAAADAESLCARAAAAEGTVCVSAHTGQGVQALLELIESAVARELCSVEMLLPHVDSGVLAEVRSQGGVVEEERWSEEGVFVRAQVPLAVSRRLHKYRAATR